MARHPLSKTAGHSHHRFQCPRRRHLTKLHKILFVTIIAVLTTTFSFQSQPKRDSLLFAQAASSTATSTSLAKDAATRSMTNHKLDFLDDLRRKYQHQPTFLQAVEEMARSLTDIFDDPQKGDFYKRAFLLMAEPERIISFRVPWMDDQGQLQHNRGWRVEFSR